MKRIPSPGLFGALLALALAAGPARAANLTAVSVSPTSVVGGLSGATGTVTLDVVAPVGGALVSLSSNNAAAVVPPASRSPRA